MDSKTNLRIKVKKNTRPLTAAGTPREESRSREHGILSHKRTLPVRDFR